MRTAQEVETQYRAALDECATRAGGELVQMRCLTDRAELRADMDQRVVAGVAVRYGDEARIYSFRERIARGALTLPTAPANLNRQHDRAIPLGLMEWIDDEDALRFRVTLPPGMAQDQALSDVSHGLLRGASLEFIPSKEKPIELGDSPLYEITEGRVLRLAIVDDGAYPQSKVQRVMPKPDRKSGPASTPTARPKRARCGSRWWSPRSRSGARRSTAGSWWPADGRRTTACFGGGDDTAHPRCRPVSK